MKRIPPLQALFFSVACQAFGFGLSIVALNTLHLPQLAVYAVHGLAAGVAAKFIRLPAIWVLVNCAAWPAAGLYQIAQLPTYGLLWVLAFLLLIYLPTYWTKVPFYPSSPQMYQAILEFLPTDRPFRFIDLGCGYGKLLSFLASQRPLGEFVGAEIAPLPALIAWLRSRMAGSKMKIIWGSFWKLPFTEYDIVYAFLAPDPMPELEKKCWQEMRPGSSLLINSFPISRPAQKQVAVKDERNCVLYWHHL